MSSVYPDLGSWQLLTSHLRKILNWPEPQLEMLIKTLKLYESYQTLDTSGKRIQGKMKRGEKLKLSKDLFKNIAKCSPAFFEANYKSVTRGEMSLKTLLIESGKAEMILKTKSMIARWKPTMKAVKIYNFNIQKSCPMMCCCLLVPKLRGRKKT